jgi:hypothetical protein
MNGKGSRRTFANCPVCHKKITIAMESISLGDKTYHKKCYKNR